MEHPRFEYKILILQERDSLPSQLNAEGETGWLLTAIIQKQDWKELILVRPQL